MSDPRSEPHSVIADDVGFHHSNPAEIFGVDGWAARPGEETTATVTSAWFDASGSFRPGALGVLVDIALGAPGVLTRPSPSHGLVTSELAIDFAGTAPGAGTRLRGPADLVDQSHGGVVTRGTVFDQATEAVVGVAHMTQRYVRASSDVIDLRSIGRSDPESSDASMSHVFGASPSHAQDSGQIRLRASDWLLNPRGTLHGGVVTALFEYAAAAALDTTGVAWTCRAIRVNFLRPVSRGADVLVSATALHTGRTISVVDASISDASDRRAAVARLTFSRDDY